MYNKEFTAIKADLKKHLELHAFNPLLSINIYSDTPKTGGMGFVLTQLDPQDEKRERVVYCSLMGLTDAQTRNSMMELKM